MTSYIQRAVNFLDQANRYIKVYESEELLINPINLYGGDKKHLGLSISALDNSEVHIKIEGENP